MPQNSGFLVCLLTAVWVNDIGLQFMSLYELVYMSDRNIATLVSNCDEFKRLRRYPSEPLSPDEASFPLAYNILIHRSVSQVEKLLRAIYAPQNVYCIHIDARADEDVYKAIVSIAKCFDNVRIASKLERIVYAGYSRLQADINCMMDHLNSSVKWKYLLNVAGQAFPLKTNREMVDILKVYNGSNDIEGLFFKFPNRVLQQWKEVGLDTDSPRLVHTQTIHSKPPHNLRLVKGSAYGIFSRKFVDFVMNDPIAVDFRNWSRFTYSPDEHYWATLHHTHYNRHLVSPGSYSGKLNNYVHYKYSFTPFILKQPAKIRCFNYKI